MNKQVNSIPIIPVVIAGGSGTRLWPVSRHDYPKPFLPLTSKKETLLQITARRLNGIKQLLPPLVIVGEEHRFIAERQLREAGITGYHIVLEPVGKNTAPAAGLAAHYIKEEMGIDDAVMILMPADHYIKEEDQLRQSVLLAADRALAGGLGTFGVKPRFPYPGYGYIRVGKEVNGTYAVDEFVEKPTKEKAKTYIEEGNYYWNSGIFVWTVSSFLEALEKHAPGIHSACLQAIRDRKKDLNFMCVGDAFKQIEADSVDYALMEKEKDIFLLPLNLTWSDIGTWHSVSDTHASDEKGNQVQGEGKIMNGNNVFIRASKDRLIATVGVDDLLIADTQDATLIVRRDKSEDVKQLVEEMRAEGREKADQQYRSHRPWGWYESLIKRDGFQVKRLAVYPGAALSLQSHKHRSEHWVVTQGEAEVTCAEEILHLKKNQSTYIPLGAKHRLRNTGKQLLIVIEVQSGDYLGEDDIVRYDDVYGRKKD